MIVHNDVCTDATAAPSGQGQGQGLTVDHVVAAVQVMIVGI